MTSPDLATAAVLDKVGSIYTIGEIAERLDVSDRQIARWKSGETPLPKRVLPALELLLSREPFQGSTKKEFRTIDLFAGIGGIRYGFETHGGECVFTSEWDAHAVKTYVENFGEGHLFEGDITKVDATAVPAHDVLLGGFPCQPFSIAGVSKKNALGRPHGFDDPTQGTLFFDVKRIIAAKRPASFMLENVKNLQRHDRGRTFATIMESLEDDLGYEVHSKVINGAHFTPQNRERIILVGFREPTNFTWDGLELPDRATGPRMRDILHKTDGTEPYLPWDGERFFDHSRGRQHDKYTLTPRLWAYLQNYAAKHRAAGNGFGFGLVGPDDTSRTLSARYYKDGSEILVAQPDRDCPRRLTPRECARLMGYPDEFRIPVSDTQAYRQFGNSVVVPVIRAVAQQMKPYITRIVTGESET